VIHGRQESLLTSLATLQPPVLRVREVCRRWSCAPTGLLQDRAAHGDQSCADVV